MHRSRVAAVAATVVVLCAVGASSAVADAVPLGGSPLNVYVGERGQLQAFRAGESNGIYFSPTQTSGDAGFFLADTDARVVNGFEGAAGPHGLALYNPIAVHPVTGTGTAADPLTQQTSYTTADTDISITQTTTYVNGSQEFRIRWDVTNTLGAGSPKHFKALVAADFFFDGSDRGTGIYTQGPPQFIGGTNADTGASGGFVEIPATSRWSAYQALAFGASPGEVWDKIENSAANLSQVLDDTVVGQQVDNAGAVEWDAYAGGGPGLDGGHTATFEIIARTAIPSALQLNPTNGGAPKGTPISFTATAVDTNGTPYAGKTLRYAITGVNATSGATTLDASGSGVITDPGTNAGADTVIAFVDFNNNGTRDTAEPQASALGHLRRQRPAELHGQGHRRPPRRQRRRRQAAGHLGQLRRGGHRDRSDVAATARGPQARGGGHRRQEEEAEEAGRDQAQDDDDHGHARQAGPGVAEALERRAQEVRGQDAEGDHHGDGARRLGQRQEDQDDALRQAGQAQEEQGQEAQAIARWSCP